MSEIVVEAALIGLLILLNGVFAMAELAVMSARQARLHDLANKGSARARAALGLIAAPDRFLSTVQIGITLVGVMAGAFGGATLAEALARLLGRVDVLAPYADALGLGLVVLLITYLSLVIGELVPKRLALYNPEGIAVAVAGPMQALARGVGPVVRLLSASSGLVVRALRLPPASQPPITEEEIRILIAQGTQAGVFNSAEQEMVESVFRLDQRQVRALMTPHTAITWLDVSDTPDEIRHKIAAGGHSRYPVCRGGLDALLGVVAAQDVLARCLATGAIDLTALLRPPRFIPETASLAKAVALLRASADHMLLVVDEHGGIQGLLTGHDLLEAIVGDLSLAGELGEGPLRREDGSWLLDGRMGVDDLKTLLGLDRLPDEDRSSYQTLGGFIMNQMGHIPAVGECFRWAGWVFEVVDMDRLRVDKVLARRENTPG